MNFYGTHSLVFFFLCVSYCATPGISRFFADFFLIVSESFERSFSLCDLVE